MSSFEVNYDILGICIQVVSCFLTALAFVLQKRAHMRVSDAGVESWFAPANRIALWIWRLGFVFMVITAVLDLISYPMLDLSKQAPMGALTLVFNSVLASVMLREPFTVLDLMSTVLISTGTITAVANSEPQSSDFSFPDIIALLNDQVVFVYSGVVLPLIISSVIFVEVATCSKPETWSAAKRGAIALLAPICGGMFMGYTGYCAKSISTVIANAEWDQVRTVGSECRCGVCNSPTCADRHRVLPACLLPYRHCAAQESACLSIRGACQHISLWAAAVP